jgi:type VI secretion system secreted protein VgrG
LYGANTTALDYAGAISASRQRPDNAFTILAVEHHAANNLGSQAAKLLKLSDVEQGSYLNHFHCAPAAAPIVPRFVRKPTAAGMQTALVIGLQTGDQQSEPLTVDGKTTEGVTDDQGWTHTAFTEGPKSISLDVEEDGVELRA